MPLFSIQIKNMSNTSIITIIIVFILYCAVAIAYAMKVDNALYYNYPKMSKKETANVDNTDVAVVNGKATEVCVINIERNVGELTYAILNTSNYNGGVGAIIVKCYTPNALKDYGFDIEECKEIGKLAVGELFTSHDYGNGAVIVRMS